MMFNVYVKDDDVDNDGDDVNDLNDDVDFENEHQDVFVDIGF